MGCTSSTQNMSDLHTHTTENEKQESNGGKHDDDILKNDTNENKDSEQVESTNVECNETEMLPTCDSLDQNLQLDRKSNSIPDITEQERDMADLKDSEVSIIMEVEKEIPSIELEEETSKFSTFEKLVDQVVLDNILDEMPNDPGKENDAINEDKTTENIEIQNNPIDIKVIDVKENASNMEESEGIIDEEDNGETASPSQSECSRATRWEALADIAAELPPSLAVDPDEEDNGETASPSQSECSRATRWEALADIAAELPPSLAVDPLTGEIFSLTK